MTSAKATRDRQPVRCSCGRFAGWVPTTGEWRCETCCRRVEPPAPPERFGPFMPVQEVFRRWLEVPREDA